MSSHTLYYAPYQKAWVITEDIPGEYPKWLDGGDTKLADGTPVHNFKLDLADHDVILVAPYCNKDYEINQFGLNFCNAFGVDIDWEREMNKFLLSGAESNARYGRHNALSLYGCQLVCKVSEETYESIHEVAVMSDYLDYLKAAEETITQNLPEIRHWSEVQKKERDKTKVSSAQRLYNEYATAAQRAKDFIATFQPKTEQAMFAFETKYKYVEVLPGCEVKDSYPDTIKGFMAEMNRCLAVTKDRCVAYKQQQEERTQRNA